MHRLIEPDDGDANYGYTFNERGDGIRDRRGRGKNDKRDDVLGKVNRTIHEEIIRD